MPLSTPHIKIGIYIISNYECRKTLPGVIKRLLNSISVVLERTGRFEN